MKSQVHVQVDDQDGKIVRVQDKWNGKLPDNTILNVRDPPPTRFIAFGVLGMRLDGVLDGW
jgi:hypothetical protein